MVILKRSGILLSLLLATGCSVNETDQETEGVGEQERAAEVVIENLDVPWEITKSEETFYLTERAGTIVTYEKGEIERQSVQLSVPIHHEGEGGLLGLQLAPDFSTSKSAFIYHTYHKEGNTFNRVVKVVLKDGEWRETKELLANIPGSLYHNGGRVKVGPDEMLYITTGDAGNPKLAQDVNSTAGKILRMTLSGTTPNDNPFRGSLVYSYGHRNPQGLAWDDKDQLYSSEHGQSAHDEINKIEAGKNYGWPVIEGDKKEQGMETPLYHSGNNTWAPSGIVVKDNKLYMAGLRGEEIRAFKLNGHESEVIIDGIGRIRSIFQEHNMIYAITNNKDGRGKAIKGDDRMVKTEIELISSK
ncbi:PQQ-dependent sugar dehydrogenase [Pseudalkalibacillus hwajinpoensis]|uniref:PQQ-dependent sugar dehydrogenase n=1 Tax=Guptibacillus hwajinpoensis TaxID=208199 RepID=A0A4V5PYS0_9BACL|nr:PQQ-dependent sugar dehydrogenase [Pseudalkalibacillus hwajinpoensis]TKD71248.1 PQQ-dependent sugar dehydrogenase [Pseudalkalibacillus hwajinpoensis]